MLLRSSMALAAVLITVVYATTARCDEEPAPKRTTYELKVYDLRAYTTFHDDKPSPYFDHPTPFGANPQPARQSGLSTSDYVALLQERLLAAEFADPNASIEENSGKMYVLQKTGVQARIPELLKRLASRTQAQVAVQALEVAISEEQALTWLGKAGQALNDKDVEALLKPDSGATLCSAPQLVTFSGQRSHVQAGHAYTYVADADVSGDALDPVVATGLDGVVLDVRPILDDRQASVLMELHYLRSARVEGSTRKKIEAHVTPVDITPDPNDEEKPAAPAPPRKPIVSRVALDLPAHAKRTLNTELRFPVETWVLAGMLEPVAGAKQGSPESRYLLVLLRCNRTAEPPGAQ